MTRRYLTLIRILSFQVEMECAIIARCRVDLPGRQDEGVNARDLTVGAS